MSMITNRKRPRGFSENFDESRKAAANEALNGSKNCGSSDTRVQFNQSPNINLNIDLNAPDSALNGKAGLDLRYYGAANEDALIEEDEDLDNEVDDVFDPNDNDVIFLEERSIKPSNLTKQQRHNSDSSHILERDVWEAYNMFNVNNAELPDWSHTPLLSINPKKQRTNSLPQLPQAKCFYQKIPNNYIIQHPKVGNIKTHVVPHKLNLPPCDDEDGHYIIKINDVFANSFVIQKLLGQGTFGKVVACYDKINRETVAIKIIRNIAKYRDAARIELRVLTTLKKFDNENRNHCIHLRECLDYRGHICIVTDLLKISLYDFLENNKFIPYPGSHIQAIAKQLVRSVTYFHDLNLIHTDLKPENILLHDDSFQKKQLRSNTIISSYLNLNLSNDKRLSEKPPKYLKILNNPLIQIIDFGSAIFDDEYHSSIVCTRHYRAPEIVLGVGWSFPCDMWSVGCILVELVIGEPVFRTHDNLEHLAMIEKVVGAPIDMDMVRASKNRDHEVGMKLFTDSSRGYDNITNGDCDDIEILGAANEEEGYRLKFPIETTPSKFVKSVEQLSRIDIFISERIGLNINFDYSLSENYQKNSHLINFGNFTFWWFFIDLLRKLFVVNPANRITALEALEHPWFNLGSEDEGTI
ncbi:kinase-like protein [Metschnikowia bicuspidata]|uniref:Kinase-like protein n=1 Tax=Metschnikowia bicuspidata TaxID=27322 RepID=A0A4P9ZDN5_9ASCO|nr:kinase-like protein [Metschnikowia bicuspidata]